MRVPSAGYSGTPLARKLGIVNNTRVHVRHAPPDYAEWLAPIPAGVEFGVRLAASTDVIHVFVDQRAALARELTDLRETMRADAALWISWPKKASKVPTDVTEDAIRDIALPMGFVDIKVCAVSDVWSGLKLVIRKALR